MYLISPYVQPVYWLLGAIAVISFAIFWCTGLWGIAKRLEYLDESGANKLPLGQRAAIYMALINEFDSSEEHAKPRRIMNISFSTFFVSFILIALLAVVFGVPVKEEAPYSCGQFLDCIFKK